MAYADDLLDLAKVLAKMEPANQATLRRAVSTAYYALFHLLISAASLNWARIELRSALSRIFEHGKMKNASKRAVDDLNAYFKGHPADTPERSVNGNLLTIANTFIQAQQRRNDADYDTSKEWTRVDVSTQIASVSAAFDSWNIIRDEPVAQAYLVSLLGKQGN